MGDEHAELRDGSGKAAFRPIRDYALIGDCHGAALVSRDGSIDWACFGRFDADPTFLSILDVDKGGRFSIAPDVPFTAERAYFDDTAILVTAFATETGHATLRDFMPVGRCPANGTYDYVTLRAPHWIVRRVECTSGRMRLRLTFRPSRDWAERPESLAEGNGRVMASSGTVLHHPLPEVSIDGDTASAVFEVSEGDVLSFVCAAEPVSGDPLSRCEDLYAVTRAFWREWIDFCRYDGTHRDIVRRSAITLKLLTYAPSGALVAAPTSSLPEEIGGGRNWDYRFCWLRDSVLALYALAVAGYGGEAKRFSDYLIRVGTGETGVPQIMYGIEGESDLSERQFPHLSGHLGSSPVRAGNGAYDQRQMDVYGELLDWAEIYRTIGGDLDGATDVLRSVADFVAGCWWEPDQGLWEIRGGPRHHVHSKIMSWVTLDRAIRLLEPKPAWVEARDAVARDIDGNGFAADGHMLQAYGHEGVDAAALLTPMMGFEMRPERLDATIREVEAQLRDGDFVHRYRSDDGLGGEEGSFLICSFWLVDALLFAGRQTEAAELFDRLVTHANDVGLFAEEIDPSDGSFLGNYPQAFTHLALIASAHHLQLCSEKGCDAMRGTYADRAKRLAGATLGFRALLSAAVTTRQGIRLLSSSDSVLRL
jgi:GH15 family glucan-1,4-alpha-glucosidase